ncbi:MAG: hypothetical protein ISS31_06685 [Kiritimatiellae bacterium]|nr:hypothetical protein [Kiritimatiellia bacterium]
MKLLRHGCWLLLVARVAAGDALADEQRAADATNTSGRVEIRVLDVVVTGADRLRIGTNTMSLAAATNFVAANLDTLDVVAVHGSDAGMSPVDTKSSALARIASGDLPLVVVERDGEYVWREESGADGVRTVTMGTDQFKALRRLWKRRRAHAEAIPSATVQTTVQWDTDTDTYGLSRIELGLFEKRVWLIHELRETDDEADAVGIQIKKEW